MPQPTTSTWQLADDRMGGMLAAHMATARAAGLSYREIAAGMEPLVRFGVDHTTVRRWCQTLGIEERAAS